MAGKARVHELAKGLGVTSKEVLSRLKDMGVYVKGSSSTIEPLIAQRLRSEFASTGNKTLGVRYPSNRRTGRSQLDGFEPFPPPRATSPSGTRKLTPFARELRDRWHLGPSEASKAAEEWLYRFIEPGEARDYMAAGFSVYDSALVRQCMDCGIEPHHLKIRIRGRRVLERIRGGDSPALIAHELRNSG